MKKYIWLSVVLSLVLGSLRGQSAYDIRHADFRIRIDTAEQRVDGKAVYKIRMLQTADSILWDAAPQVEILSAGKHRFRRRDKKVVIYGRFRKGKSYEIPFLFRSHPVKGMYFTGWGTEAAEKQVWTQGQGKNNSSWMPGKDDTGERFTWNITIAFPAEYRIISNGQRISASRKGAWKAVTYRMDKPVPYYLLFVGAGNWRVLRDTVAGVPYENYFYADTARAHFVYRHDSLIRTCLEDLTGIPYPWAQYRQIPLRDFFYGGMENVTATTYHDKYLQGDTLPVDRLPYVTLAHEAAHQWFGDYVTEKNPSHHWLHESFATWLSYETDKCITGRDAYLWHFYDDRRQIIEAWHGGDTVPVQNGKASTLSFYQKGAWLLRMMQARTGREKFREVMRDFLRRHPYATVTTADFQESLQRITGDSMPDFFRRWFRSSRIPHFTLKRENGLIRITGDTPEAELGLRIYDKQYRHRDLRVRAGDSVSLRADEVFFIPDPDIRLLAELDWEADFRDFVYAVRAGLKSVNVYRMLRRIRGVPYATKRRLLADMARNDYHYPVYEEIIEQIPARPDSTGWATLKQLFGKGPREQILVITHPEKLPAQHRPWLETALTSPSPQVRMYALFPLWQQFPKQRVRYLNTVKDFDNPHDHSLRMLWIILAIETEGYLTREQAKALLDELIAYASPRYNVDTRLWALDWIGRLHLYTPQSLQYIRLAKEHFHPALRRKAGVMMKELGM